jgi:hypothetical protein
MVRRPAVIARRLVLATAWLAVTQTARAHDGDFVISRDNASPPRLQWNGQSNLVDGLECIPLIRGDGPLQGYWFNDAPGFMTMRHDGDVRTRLRLMPGHRIALRLVHADKGFAMLEPSTWKPVLVRDGDEYPFFLDKQGDFTMQMLPRADHAGAFRATLQLVDLAGLHKPSAPLTLCFSSEQTATTQSRASSMPAADGHVHGPARPFAIPGRFSEAVTDFRMRLHEIDAAIAARKLYTIPAEAEVIRRLTYCFVPLAFATTSGVPLSENGKLTGLARMVDDRSNSMVRSAKWSDAIAVREYARDLYTLLDLFEAYVPRMYSCPMRCEEQKNYPQPGKCPVCHMRLADTRAHLDHQPKHGGIFFMAPDNLHHLEGAMVGGVEFRIYFYDEFTKPISAKPFTVRAEIHYSDRDEIKAIVLEHGPSTDFLVGKLPAGEKLPVHVKLFADFKDGGGPQVFDFDFDK